jgi:endonuclease/exonuclease/phosphatase family metal-dependent hydrolase
VDVLCLAELTVGAMLRLDRAGLTSELDAWVLQPASRGFGSGIMARGRVTNAGLGGPEIEVPDTRVPLRAQVVDGGEDAVQPIVDVTLPGARAPLRVQAIHAPHPDRGRVARWERSLRGLPEARAEAAPDVLAGDFNATLDHAELRDVLERGWTDAAADAGDGLTRTWPVGRTGGPHLAIDHVLVRPGVAVRSFAAVDVPGSDHRAVIARLELP